MKDLNYLTGDTDNFLEHTTTALETCGKKWDDVLWCGSEDIWFTAEHFKVIANLDYDSGFGGQEVATDLMIVGSNWWLERHEYDGSEWWEYKEYPRRPDKNINVTKLVDSNNTNATLEEINFKGNKY